MNTVRPRSNATKRAAARDMDDVKTGGNRESLRKPSDVVDIYQFPDKKFVRLRLLPGIYSYGGHWIKTEKKGGGIANFYSPCLSWDPSAGERQGGNGKGHCPWCTFEANFYERFGKSQDNPCKSNFTVDHYMNAIIRSLTKGKPEENELNKNELKSGFKEKESEAWTPVRAVRLTGSVVNKIRELKQMNTHSDGDNGTRAVNVSDPKLGRDIMVMLDEKAAPANRYQVQIGDPAPLKKFETNYLVYDLSDLSELPEVGAAEEDFKRWAERNKVDTLAGKKSKGRSEEDEEEDGDDDDDDMPPPKKSAKKPVSKKASRDEDEDDEDEDEDEEDSPPKKSTKKPAPKKSSRDDEDEDEDDEDEDDSPPPKKSSKKPAPKKSSRDDEDEEEDEDDEEDEDEDEDDAPPPKKSAKKPVSKKSSRDDDDEDDEDEEDEDDEDEAPPKKSVKKPAPKKVVKKSSRDEDEEDEEDEDEEDEDDDSDFVPKKKVVKKPVTKKASRDEDEDDEDDEDEDDEPPKKPVKKAATKVRGRL